MKRLNRVLSNVLGVEASSITDATSPDTVASWDSFNGLMLVSELETEFGVHFTMQEVTDVRSVGDIKKALAKHGVRLEGA
jgi:acyl carrier protein